MRVSRCCKSDVMTQHTENGEYFRCVMCHRVCDSFTMIVLNEALNDEQYGFKDPEGSLH